MPLGLQLLPPFDSIIIWQRARLEMDIGRQFLKITVTSLFLGGLVLATVLEVGVALEERGKCLGAQQLPR